VSPERRDRILAVIDALGYIPSAGAQQLAGGRSRSIGLLIRDSRNPAYGLLHSEIQRRADEAGLEVITAMPTSYRGAPQEMDALRRLLALRVGGLLVATGVVRTAELTQLAPVLPVLSVGRPEDDPAIYGVSYDEIGNGHAIAEAIVDHGHRRVAVVHPPTENSLAESLRGRTAAERLRERGAEVVEVPTTQFGTAADGTERVIDLVRDGAVTAAMFSSDLRMLDFVSRAREVGIEVPRDLSVIGCDGVLHGLPYMGLASLRVPVEEVARRSVEVIAQMMADPDSVGIRHETYPGQLLPGASLGS
jgi:LacI family transcriptional regulator